jgi:hypothetical protein
MSIANTIIALYPNVARVENDEKAFDANGNEVVYDLQAVTAQAQANAQTAKDVKASALAKLVALGLTQDEIKALVG